MGGRWTYLLLLAIAAVPVWSLEYNITTTWNGGEIDHAPIQLTLSGSKDYKDYEYLELSIVAPFFNDPPAPPGPAGQPFFGLWEYEVVEVFFLNDDNQYVEVEVCPWGQHIVLLLNGQRVTIRHSLPMEVTTNILENIWTGTAKIPVEYLPMNVTKFNAYGIHGSGANRIYESLYPASENATAPDFHALEYFSDIDLSEILPSQETDDMSEFWTDSIEGIFRYRIKTTWNNVPVNHNPVEITLQGYTAGVEMNVTAPFFNDTPPAGEEGKPFYRLWDYEVVEMFFLNDKDEYLEVELGPWGQHLLLILKGARNALTHSMALDYIIIERNPPSEGTLGQWKGSAMLPPGYFPPNVTRMNAYAIHGTGDNREYQSLYPAPNSNPEYPVPDFHRLELFRPIDFQFQVTNNSYYSKVWQDAMASGSAALTSVVETEEEVEAVTMLGPAAALFQPTSAPIQPLVSLTTQEQINDISLSRKPKPQRVLPDEPREQRLENEVGVLNPATFGPVQGPKPQPVRIGDRDIETPLATNQQRRPLQHNVRFTDDNLQLQGQRRPLRQPQRATSEFQSQGQAHGQFQDERIVQGNAQFQDQRTQFLNQGQRQGPPADRGTSQFSNQGQFPFQGQDQPQTPRPFQTQEETFGTSQVHGQRQPAIPIQEQSDQDQGHPQFQEQDQFSNQNIRHSERPSLFQNQEETQFQNQGQPQFQNQGQPQFQSQGQPQFQSQGQPQSQNQGRPQFENQGRPQFQNQGRPQFQNQGRPQFQNERQPQFQEESQPQFQTPHATVSQGQGPPRFQDQGRPPIQFPELPPSADTSLPTQAPHFQTQNQGFQQEHQPVNVRGSVTSNSNPSLDIGLQDNITPEVEQAVITLAEETPALPPPHPVCFELGLVPDPDRCYIFHECVLEAGEWQMYSWRCRRGQVFDPVNVACIRGRCARTQSRRRRVKRS